MFPKTIIIALSYPKKLLLPKKTKKVTKSFFNKRFSSNIVINYSRPKYNSHFYSKNFFSKTNNNLLAKHITTNIAFCSTNSIIGFASLWENFLKSDETEFITPILNFLAQDFQWFNYFAVKFIQVQYNRQNPINKVRKLLQQFLSLYLEFSRRNLYHLYDYVYYLKPRVKNEFVVYRLYLTFTGSRIYANLGTKFGPVDNYFSLSLGLFLKFFKKKKSIKKTKMIKILLMKYIRKLFIISGIISFELFINRTPILLEELINALCNPTGTFFTNPLNNYNYDDTVEKTTFNFMGIYYITPRPYGVKKGPKKGRLKRKIMRRLIRMNKVLD